MLGNLLRDIQRLFPEDSHTTGPAQVRAMIRGVLSPGFQAIIVYRSFHWARRYGIPTQPLRFLCERFIEVTTGISIPVDADIGPGLRIHHFGGVILHPGVKMGAGCTLYHDVTLGTDGLSEQAPALGDDVLIGAGARVLGGVTIGARSRIGANAVVVSSFPEDSVLVGVPAHDARPPSKDQGR